MKKLLFAVALLVTIMFASCGNGSKVAADTDSVAVDSIAVMDSVAVDSITLDSVPADSVVCGDAE